MSTLPQARSRLAELKAEKNDILSEITRLNVALREKVSAHDKKTLERDRLEAIQEAQEIDEEISALGSEIFLLEQAEKDHRTRLDHIRQFASAIITSRPNLSAPDTIRLAIEMEDCLQSLIPLPELPAPATAL